jgi:hypothetical protein
MPPQVGAETGKAADQIIFGQHRPLTALHPPGGGGKPVASESGDGLVQEGLRGLVAGLGSGVEGEGKSRRPVIKTGALPSGEFVAGCGSQPVVRLLPPGVARAGAFDVEKRDPGGSAAERLRWPPDGMGCLELLGYGVGLVAGPLTEVYGPFPSPRAIKVWARARAMRRHVPSDAVSVPIMRAWCRCRRSLRTVSTSLALSRAR